ncbi:MAG: NUDIX domain-containing protein [Salinibacter sp.]
MATRHILARAVIRDEGQVLVVRAKGQSHTFLPGGHREDGEGLEHCLHRELDEELGVQAQINAYRGGGSTCGRGTGRGSTRSTTAFRSMCRP